MNSFRFRLMNLGVLTGMFDTRRLAEVLREACAGGYRLLRREFTLERRRFLFFFPALAFGMVFRRDEQAPSDEFDYQVAVYKTRLLTRTVNSKQMSETLNRIAGQGYELFFSFKYPTRLLWIFPRESYIFVFRKPTTGAAGEYNYSVFQTPYRFFTRTIDPVRYEADLNQLGQGSQQLKITFRDERRIFGMFRQQTIVGIAETARAAAMRDQKAA